jgi:hypothetical protein
MQGIEALPGRLPPLCAQREEEECLGISGDEIEEADLIEWRGMDTSHYYTIILLNNTRTCRSGGISTTLATAYFTASYHRS